MTLDRDQLQDLARRYTDAWCSQDPANVADHYAPGGSLTINGGQPAEGRAALIEVARSFMTAFPDMSIGEDGLIAESQDHYDHAEYDRQLQHGAA